MPAAAPHEPAVYNRRAMQPVTVQEQVEYASLGWRFTAVLIDTAVLFGILIAVLMAYVFVLAAQGRIDPNDPAAAQALSREISRQLGDSNLLTNVIVFGSLFVYYVVLEAIFAASVGKLVCRMRVTMADGSRPTGLAVVVRNLIRVPEAIFFYVPSAISCAASPRRQRLGDHAARTVVMRRTTVSAAAAGAAPRAAPGAPPYAGPRPGAPAFGAPRPGRPRGAAGRGGAGRLAGRGTRGGAGGPSTTRGRDGSAEDGGACHPRRAPELPALLRARARGRRRGSSGEVLG